MAKAILNNVFVSGNEEEAIRDGYYVRKPNGELQITQKALKAFAASVTKMEKLAGLVSDGLKNKSASVEEGDLDAGLYIETKKKVNWRAEFVVIGGDPKKVNADAPKVDSAPRLRIHETGEKQKGRKLAPAADSVEGAA